MIKKMYRINPANPENLDKILVQTICVQKKTANLFSTILFVFLHQNINRPQGHKKVKRNGQRNFY
jgi:hypothetical protein